MQVRVQVHGGVAMARNQPHQITQSGQGAAVGAAQNAVLVAAIGKAEGRIVAQGVHTRQARFDGMALVARVAHHVVCAHAHHLRQHKQAVFKLGL